MTSQRLMKSKQERLRFSCEHPIILRTGATPPSKVISIASSLRLLIISSRSILREIKHLSSVSMNPLSKLSSSLTSNGHKEKNNPRLLFLYGLRSPCVYENCDVHEYGARNMDNWKPGAFVSFLSDLISANSTVTSKVKSCSRYLIADKFSRAIRIPLFVML